MPNVRIAMVGCGNMGSHHLDCMCKEKTGLVPWAMVDMDRKKAEEACSKWGAKYYTTDYDRALKDPDIDAVMICTHHETHARLCIEAAKYEKDIFVEKPLALKLEECLDVERTVKSTAVKFMIGYCERFSTLSAMARELVPHPTITWGRQIDGRWPDDHWAQDPVTGGGNVFSQGCHTMDLIAWFNPSKPVRISAEGGTLTHKGTEVIDNIISTITFENGSIGAAIIGDCGPGGLPKLSYELIGEGKGAYINNFYELWADTKKKDVKLRIFGGEGYVTGGWDYGVPQEQEAFAKYISEGGPSPVPVEDAIRASIMILKAFESIRAGKPRSLP